MTSLLRGLDRGTCAADIAMHDRQIARRFSFAEVREAHRVAERGVDGKVILVR